jgi:hypothetical protein
MGRTRPATARGESDRPRLRPAGTTASAQRAPTTAGNVPWMHVTHTSKATVPAPAGGVIRPHIGVGLCSLSSRPPLVQRRRRDVRRDAIQSPRQAPVRDDAAMPFGSRPPSLEPGSAKSSHHRMRIGNGARTRGFPKAIVHEQSRDRCLSLDFAGRVALERP